MKYIWTVLLVISSILLYFYHGLVFNSINFSKKYKINVNFKNDYLHYYYMVDENPVYVLKKNLLDKYIIRSFKNKKTGLLYSNQQTISDLNYISDIQYAASFKDIFNARFLYNELNYVTNLSPYWINIYGFSQLILPVNKKSDSNELGKIESWKNTIKIGEKGILFNCNSNKIKNILLLKNKDFFKLTYLQKGNLFKENKNPCPNYKIASDLGFNYMYYLKDYENAIKYYKIASFQENVPYGIIGMVSVINSISGEHEKALYMFFERLKGIEKKLNNKNISDKELKQIKDYYDLTMKRLQEEFNLYIISQADEKGVKCKKDYKCLWRQGYIHKTISNLKENCKTYIGKLDLTNIDKDVNQTINKIKCTLLFMGNKSGFIQKNKLISPLLNSDLYRYEIDKGIWNAYKTH